MIQATMAPIAIVTVIALLECFYFAFAVGKARSQFGVKAPATSGDPVFERHFRVHQNTLEQLVIFLPSLWLFGFYVHALAGALIGLVFVIGRLVYGRSYVADPTARGTGFIIGMAAMLALLLGGLIGAVLAMF